MKINKAEIIRVNIPLKKPFIVSFGSVDVRDIVYIKLYDESGEWGIGEAPVISLPIYKPEIPESVMAVFEKAIFPVLKGKKIDHPSEIDQHLNYIKGNQFAKSAVSNAAYDLFGKLNNKSLKEVIGGTKSSLTISFTLPIFETIEELLEYADYLVNERKAEFLKLKTKPGYDLDYLVALKNKFPNIKLMLDANSSYILDKETLELYNKIDELGLYAIEQPLQSYDIIDHAKLQAEMKSNIAIDESIDSYYMAAKAIELGSCKLINIKVPRVGGINESIKINDLASKNGISTWIGGMLESPIGFMSNLACATLENCDYPIDFLGNIDFIKDFESLFEKLPYEINGDTLIPDLSKSGLGGDINYEKLMSYKTAEKILA